MNPLRRLFKSQSGTSIIEFAIVAPFLILLVIGLIEFGRYMYFGILAAHAAEAGAQYAAQNTTNMNNQSGITSAVDGDGGSLTWTVHPNVFCEQVGAAVTCPVSPNSNFTYYVTVKVTGTFSSLLNYPGVPNQLNVFAQTTMRVSSN